MRTAPTGSFPIAPGVPLKSPSQVLTEPSPDDFVRSAQITPQGHAARSTDLIVC